jgi:hypothetical protein
MVCTPNELVPVCGLLEVTPVIAVLNELKPPCAGIDHGARPVSNPGFTKIDSGLGVGEGVGVIVDEEETTSDDVGEDIGEFDEAELGVGLGVEEKSIEEEDTTELEATPLVVVGVMLGPGASAVLETDSIRELLDVEDEEDTTTAVEVSSEGVGDPDEAEDNVRLSDELGSVDESVTTVLEAGVMLEASVVIDAEMLLDSIVEEDTGTVDVASIDDVPVEASDDAIPEDSTADEDEDTLWELEGELNDVGELLMDVDELPADGDNVTTGVDEDVLDRLLEMEETEPHFP